MLVDFLKNHKSTILKFILQTVFYTVILMILFYLYGYSGVGQGHFIYNEF
ncbi:teichoic acid D-Ala incorporation-associated protein DltX [Companilactobacillus sp. DQM5]